MLDDRPVEPHERFDVGFIAASHLGQRVAAFYPVGVFGATASASFFSGRLFCASTF